GTPRVRLSYCDLKTGKSSGELAYNSAAVPVDLSPSGSLIAAVPESGPAGNVRRMLEIQKSDGTKARLLRRWNMGAYAEAAKQFEDAHFVSEDKLLTLTSWGGIAAVWNIDKAECQWAIQFASHTTPALSPGHKQLAVVTGGSSDVGILDTANGNTLATIDTDGATDGRLAYSPDGNR